MLRTTSHPHSPARWSPRRAATVAGAAAAACALVATTVPAAAAEDASPWAPYSACPVDSAGMMDATVGNFGILCVAAVSPHGTFTIGSTTVTTGSTTVQFGVAGSEQDNGHPDADPGYGNVVPAENGRTLAADPADIPGGLLDLEHTLNPNGGSEPVGLGGLLGKTGQTIDHLLGSVQAQVELAGAPTDFRAVGALSADNGPIFKLPVKIHLINAALGKNCYIGSDSDPIVLQPSTLVMGSAGGTNKTYTRGEQTFAIPFITISGSTLGDDSFAVPAATGCGPSGLLNGAVNSKVGLPSPAGQNSLVLDDATAHTALGTGSITADDFAWAWHQDMG